MQILHGVALDVVQLRQYDARDGEIGFSEKARKT